MRSGTGISNTLITQLALLATSLHPQVLSKSHLINVTRDTFIALITEQGPAARQTQESILWHWFWGEKKAFIAKETGDKAQICLPDPALQVSFKGLGEQAGMQERWRGRFQSQSFGTWSFVVRGFSVGYSWKVDPLLRKGFRSYSRTLVPWWEAGGETLVPGTMGGPGSLLCAASAAGHVVWVCCP